LDSTADIPSASRLHEIANAVSLGRFAGAVLLLAVYLVAGNDGWVAAFWIVCVIWLSDIADGRIAREARRRGGTRRDGQALDALVDDFAYAAGFLVLMDAGVVPLWFVTLALMSRTLFALVRMVSLVQGREFPAPRTATKLKGLAFGGGQIVLFASLAYPRSSPHGDIVTDLALAGMTTACVIAILVFVVRTHRYPLIDLVWSRRAASHLAAPHKAPAPDARAQPTRPFDREEPSANTGAALQQRPRPSPALASGVGLGHLVRSARPGRRHA
jgi:phosphatidylglycerophosphate synthase